MKLNSFQIEQTLHQIEAEAVPPDHPLMAQLERMFGDHTYFLDSSGLNIVEPVGSKNIENPLGLLVNLANWTDADAPELKMHAPEATDILVALGTNSSH